MTCAFEKYFEIGFPTQERPAARAPSQSPRVSVLYDVSHLPHMPPVVAQLESPPTPDELQRPKRAKVPEVMLSAERDAASCARRDFGAQLVNAA